MEEGSKLLNLGANLGGFGLGDGGFGEACGVLGVALGGVLKLMIGGTLFQFVDDLLDFLAGETFGGHRIIG